MTDEIKIKTALISVYAKDHIEEISRKLDKLNIHLFSTGGTWEFLMEKGIKVTSIESLTSYPSILGGRVKTLHPKVFGGILWRRDQLSDMNEMETYNLPSFDLVIVDLYPFEKTLESGATETEIIEKIDIGGISLIRAAAKNYQHVLVIPAASFYHQFIDLLEKKNGFCSITERKYYATQAFNISSHYDNCIFNYFNREEKIPVFKQSITENHSLRYGENPHQKGIFHGNLSRAFSQLHGKELSYNNLVDIDAAFQLIREFDDPCVVIIKHTNACGVACRHSLKQAYLDALACDPVSAYGGVIIVNRKIDNETASEIDKLFFEILIAENYENDAIERLKSRKNRIILQKHSFDFPGRQMKSVLNGILEQDRDFSTESESDFKFVTRKQPNQEDCTELIFANKIVKHLKSNTIVLTKNHQLIGCGVGQTSRVDALKQAISKALSFGFETKGSVMASDAFFPFADSVEIAFNAGITSVIQPGGSIRDDASINFCNEHDMSMVFTGTRHFKH